MAGPGRNSACLKHFIIFVLCTLMVGPWQFTLSLSESTYTDDFAVEIDGDSTVADLVASIYGFTLVRQVSDLGMVYHFKHENVARLSRRSADDLIGTLNSDPNVKYVERQQLLSRDRRLRSASRDASGSAEQLRLERENILETRTTGVQSFGFNDPHFNDQWYLINLGQTGGEVGYDLNVLPVWRKGITGKDVVVSILDDGVDHSHPDLIKNYDKAASTDLNDRADTSNDPMPNLSDPDNNHGTRCAGEVAASANNSNCCVGIAYNARIGGVRMLDGPVTDLLEAEAISFNNQYIDIYSASWGPPDDGKTMEGPHRYCRKAFEQGVIKGRHGLGSIFVWATGNGGLVGDTCSCDGYVSSIYTLSVGSISEKGLSTYFSEVCPSTMAVVFAGGSHVIPGDVNYHAPAVKVVTTDVGGKCTTEFQGTSSAAPLAAGCIALVLEANSNLTWRDVQNIVVETARIPNIEEEGWVVNGGGYHVNHHFGFGVLDCAKMVEAAQSWTTVAEQHKCVVKSANRPGPIHASSSINQTLFTDGCRKNPSSTIDHLEHVQVLISVKHERRGDVNLVLTSPSGTRSNILTRRPLDVSADGFNHTFMTVHNWGENPYGKWTLTVIDNPGNTANGHNAMDGIELGTERGKLVAWSLTLYGIKGSRVNHNKERLLEREDNEEKLQQREDDGKVKARVVDKKEVESLMANEVRASETAHIMEMRKKTVGKSSAVRSIHTDVEEEEEGEGFTGTGEKDVEFLRKLFEIEKHWHDEEGVRAPNVQRNLDEDVEDVGALSGDNKYGRYRTFDEEHEEQESQGESNTETKDRYDTEEEEDDGDSWAEIIRDMKAILKSKNN